MSLFDDCLIRAVPGGEVQARLAVSLLDDYVEFVPSTTARHHDQLDNDHPHIDGYVRCPAGLPAPSDGVALISRWAEALDPGGASRDHVRYRPPNGSSQGLLLVELPAARARLRAYRNPAMFDVGARGREITVRH